MTDYPFLSVVIASYGRPALLRETIADTLEQDYPRYEVIVVDQSESPIPQPDPRVTVLHTRPPHLPRARNVGVRAARGDVVVFIDDDVALPRSFLAAHAACYRDERIGGVAGRVIVDPELRRPLAAAPAATGADFDRAHAGEVPFVRGCNMSFRRAALFDAELFDERLSSLAWSEEEDISFRMRKLGYMIVFEPHAWLVHYQTPSGGMRADSSVPADRPDFYRDRLYFSLKNVGGLDFWRLGWDMYRHTVPPRAHGGRILTRQMAFARGLFSGLVLFLKYGKRYRPLPYRARW